MIPTFETIEYAIGGKMVVASVQISQFDMDQCRHNNNAREQMRRMMVEQLVGHILDNNLVEINTMKEPIDMNNFGEMHRIIARCYLAKDADIKILRTYG